MSTRYDLDGSVDDHRPAATHRYGMRVDACPVCEDRGQMDGCGYCGIEMNDDEREDACADCGGAIDSADLDCPRCQWCEASHVATIRRSA